MLIGGVVQRRLISDMSQLKGVFWGGYLSRFMATGLLAGIVVKIILLIREGQQKSKENEQLKSAYLVAELELLKGQLNPHFLFNSLSSLSGIVREDPVKARYFISHLSKIFRYALAQPGSQLVTIENELTMIKSYEELLKMRFEGAFQLETSVDKSHFHIRIPHLSLQPLLENAAKHNSATVAKPLKVSVFIADNKLIVSNNLQEIAEPENSTGIGLTNLNQRFMILLHEEIEIIKNKESFTVKLPLGHEAVAHSID